MQSSPVLQRQHTRSASIASKSLRKQATHTQALGVATGGKSSEPMSPSDDSAEQTQSKIHGSHCRHKRLQSTDDTSLKSGSQSMEAMRSVGVLTMKRSLSGTAPVKKMQLDRMSTALLSVRNPLMTCSSC
jgi:hypothetical protein